MSIQSALEEIAANNVKRQRALTANTELEQLFGQQLPNLCNRLAQLAKDVEEFSVHAMTLLNGQAEDLNDEPIIGLTLGEK